MLDKTKRYLVVGLGLLGGKYALELTKAGFHVDGINRSEGHLQYALTSFSACTPRPCSSGSRPTGS